METMKLIGKPVADYLKDNIIRRVTELRNKGISLGWL